MKNEVFKRWFWSILEYLMIFPVLLIIAGFTFVNTGAHIFTLVLPLHMLVAIMITSLLKRFRNFLMVIIGVVYVSVVTLIWNQIGLIDSTVGTIICVLVTAFFFIWGVRAAIGEEIRTLFFYSGGLVLHGIALFLFHQAPVLAPVKDAAVVVAIVYVIVGLPLANRRFLVQASRQKSSLRTIPGLVVRGNKTIVICILAGMILLSFWQTFIDAVTFLARGIVWVIGKVIDFITSLYHVSEEGEQGGGGGQMMLPPAEESQSVLSIILNIIAVLLVLFLLFLLLRSIIKNHKRIIKALQSFFSGLFGRFQKWSSTEQGYFDQQESLLKTEIEKKPSMLRRLFKREPRWRDMKDNASRIRFIYGKFVMDHIRKGFSFHAADTPNETVDRISEGSREEEKSHEDIRNAYTQVRYGDKQTNDATVKALKDTYL